MDWDTASGWAARQHGLFPTGIASPHEDLKVP